MLAQTLQVSKPSVINAIEKLEGLGYTRKVNSDEDRRSYHIHLSEKDQGFIHTHDSVHRGLAQLLTSSLDESEAQQLLKLAQKVVYNLESYFFCLKS
jgi:DNA-binding MarR family transcriptional regulator